MSTDFTDVGTPAQNKLAKETTPYETLGALMHAACDSYGAFLLAIVLGKHDLAMLAHSNMAYFTNTLHRIGTEPDMPRRHDADTRGPHYRT